MREQKRGGEPNAIILGETIKEHLKGMTEGELKVYTILRQYASSAGMTQITLPTLWTRAGVTRQALHKIITRLVKKGIVRKYLKPGSASAILRPNAPKNTWIFYT